jgi:hypothetical protein
MANIMKDHLIDPLTALIRSDLAMPVFWDTEYQARSPRYVALQLLSDDFIEEASTTQTRRVRVLMRLYDQRADVTGVRTYEQWLADGVEAVKAVIFENRCYSDDGDYCWHNAQVENIDYSPELTEAEQDTDSLSAVWLLVGFTITELA